VGDFTRVRPSVLDGDFETQIRYRAMLSVASMCDSNEECQEFLKMLGLIDELGNFVESEYAPGYIKEPNKDVAKR
jgi:hypothetical protein